jgi:hypothetical protein
MFDTLSLPSVDGLAWNLIAAPTSLTLELVAATTADFNGDGVVDGADFLAWQRGVGVAEPAFADGDANGDGLVDGADLAVWSEQFGPPSASPAAIGVPEPNCLGICSVAAVFAAALCRGGAVASRYNVRS